ncbi:hypothetical protein AB6A40_003127 [Gnathostoma spinigerum]|uniref:Helicase ATP-binding domain-containing protein n=1 Tax=Gnathostoma spinigerum TaxID=75299 RepID=A0ABD6E8L9_9BILA
MVARSNDVDDNFFTPRDYQVELVEKACQGNIIIPLGTGSGKTFIAVLVIKNYVGQLVVPISRGGKRAFFLVDKVSLVDQQATHIECHVTVAVGRMHGSLNVDVWSDKSKFDIFIEQHQVVVLTAQIFLDLIDHGYWSLNDTALIVLDECHHVLGSKHAYRQIMNHYSRMEGDKPRIIGLTASLINNKTPPSSLEQALIKLETIMDCSIETASSLVSVS